MSCGRDVQVVKADADRALRCSGQIEVFRTELQDSETKLEQLTAKLGELQTSKHAHQAAVNVAKKELAQQKGFSKHEVYSLQGKWVALSTFLIVRGLTCFPYTAEFSSIQHLHLWQLERLETTGLQVIFDKEIRLTATCKDFRPEMTSVKVELVDPLAVDCKEDGPTKSLFAMLLHLVAQNQGEIRSFSQVSLAASLRSR